MRLRTSMAASFLLSVTTLASAQEWIQFTSVEDRFTCNFPGQPTITQTTYTS